jgi:hypothetical protein
MGFVGRRLVTLVAAAVAVMGVADAAPRTPPARPAKVQNTIRGATQMFVAPWGLAAQGSGQLRVLPLGKTRWQVIHQVKGGSLYRIAFDDRGRLLGWWETEPHIHLFQLGTTTHETLALPPAPGPEFKYGWNVEDVLFTPDGTGAIVYMHGFLGGRTWETVAYHYDLVKRSAPTLLFRQPGHPLHTSARATVRAVPKNPTDMCEHTACHPLGAIIAWEIDGAKATRRVLLDGKARKETFARVLPVWGSDGTWVSVVVEEHPKNRHLLRWRWGDSKATLAVLPPGPDYDAQMMWVTRSGDVVEPWLTEDRGLEIRRHPVKGKMTVTTLAPHPRRTPRDRPLFHLAGMDERESGDLLLYWGEYLVVVPVSAPPRHLDLRSVFRRKVEFSGRLLHVRDPEGTWIGIENGRNTDFTFLPAAELDARMSPAP